MIRKQFSLDEWLKDQSRKVVTKHGEPVKIVFTDGMGNWPVLAIIYDGDTTDSAWYTRDGLDIRGDKGLFIVTDEPEELTRFEKALGELLFHFCDLCLDIEFIKTKASELLELAQKELENSDWIKDIRERCYNKGHLEGYAKGQEDAEKRHKEVTSFHYDFHPMWPSCFFGGPCTNPYYDCINCPRKTTGGVYTGPNTAIGTSTLKEEKK